MIKVSLLEFIRTGSFGSVTLGLDREQVRRLLGSPDDWSAQAQSDRHARIWKYGTTEFHFSEGKLWLIHADDFDVPDGGARIDLDPWVLRRGLSAPHLKQALNAAHIPFGCESDPSELGVISLCTAARVRFLFSEPVGLSAFSLKAYDHGG